MTTATKERMVPGPVAVAIMTGRPELVKAFRAQIKEGLTEETADGILDAAEELVEMRHQILAEAERMKQLIEIVRQSAQGMFSTADRLEARLQAFITGADPDEAEEQAIEERKQRNQR
jgi:hypothetical protein